MTGHHFKSRCPDQKRFVHPSQMALAHPQFAGDDPLQMPIDVPRHSQLLQLAVSMANRQQVRHGMVRRDLAGHDLHLFGGRPRQASAFVLKVAVWRTPFIMISVRELAPRLR